MPAVLGLTEDESRCYRELLMLGPSCSSTELAAATGVDEGQATQLLGRLEQLGLVARSAGSPDRLTASPPEVALGALLVQRQNELKHAEIELSSLQELYRTGVAERGATDVIDVVHGPDATRQRLEQLQDGARNEALGFVQAPTRLVHVGENRAEQVALARGVSFRVVLERRVVVEEPNFADALDLAIAAGQDVRVTDTVPLKLLVVDRQLALVPITGTNRTGVEGALLVRPSALLGRVDRPVRPGVAGRHTHHRYRLRPGPRIRLQRDR